MRLQAHFMDMVKEAYFAYWWKNAEKYQTLSTIGIGSLSAAQEQSWAEFVGAMYGKTNCISLNKLRAEKSDKDIQVKKLPPTEDSLHQQLLRVMYQLYIWITANYVAWQELPRAQDYGYKMVEDK